MPDQSIDALATGQRNGRHSRAAVVGVVVVATIILIVVRAGRSLFGPIVAAVAGALRIAGTAALRLRQPDFRPLFDVGGGERRWLGC